MLIPRWFKLQLSPKDEAGLELPSRRAFLFLGAMAGAAACLPASPVEETSLEVFGEAVFNHRGRLWITSGEFVYVRAGVLPLDTPPTRMPDSSTWTLAPGVARTLRPARLADRMQGRRLP